MAGRFSRGGVHGQVAARALLFGYERSATGSSTLSIAFTSLSRVRVIATQTREGRRFYIRRFSRALMPV